MTLSPRTWSVRRQIVVLTACVTAVGMLLLTVVVQLVLARVSSRDVDRVLNDRAEAVVSAILVDRRAASEVPPALLDAGVAVYDARGRLIAGSAPEHIAAEYADLGRARTRTVRAVGHDDRVEALPFRTATGQRGVVVVTERTQPYEEAERLALIVSLVTGTLMTAAAAATAAWATRRALRPVAEMARTAEDWSEHDLGRRFDLGRGSDDEIRALASTLDNLLDRVSHVIRSEQRLTSELAHELRTPLTTIQGTVELILMRDDLPARVHDDLEEAVAASRRLAATITDLLELARNESALIESAQGQLADVVGEVRRDCSGGTVIEADVTDALLALPHALAVRALSPVVENAVRFADSSVSIESRRSRRGFVDVLVRDDGPGVPDADLESIFEPGRTSDRGAGAGLGLAISRRIARSAGGDVRLEAHRAGHGATFIVELPLAQA